MLGLWFAAAIVVLVAASVHHSVSGPQTTATAALAVELEPSSAPVTAIASAAGPRPLAVEAIRVATVAALVAATTAEVGPELKVAALALLVSIEWKTSLMDHVMLDLRS